MAGSFNTYGKYSLIEINNCTFKNYSALEYGAISISHSEKLRINNTIFEKNQAGRNTGALKLVYTPDVIIENC